MYKKFTPILLTNSKFYYNLLECKLNLIVKYKRENSIHRNIV